MVASLLFDGNSLPREFVLEAARRGRTALESLGCAEGAVVGIMLRNEPTYLIAALACRLGGFYACPINWHFKADEAGHILKDSGARVLIIHSDLLNQIARAVPPDISVVVVEPPPAVAEAFYLDRGSFRTGTGSIQWTDLLRESSPHPGPDRQPRSNLAYSSGTTGKPKGIKREAATPEQVERIAELCRIAFGIAPGMRTAVVAPVYHSAPALYGMQALLTGELISIHPRFDPEALLSEIERLQLTHLYLVPTMYVRLLRLPPEVKSRYDLSSLQVVASTGSPCPPQIKQAMIDWWGPIITETYASSEASLITFCSAKDALERPGTAGRPLPWCALKIMDKDGDELPPGEVGSIYTRNEASPEFTYLNNESARADIERGGYLCVGDLGWLDRDGFLYVRDRSADMVISGGVNIYPAEIEGMLMEMPEVLDCAVFGIPHPEFGESLAAHVQTRPGTVMSAEEVRAFLRERIADYKVPRLIVFAEELPREETGKVFKRKLRDAYWRGVERLI